MTRGHWIICVRDIPSGEDDYLGFYHSPENAQRDADRLNADIAARGAEGTLDAIVEWVRPTSTEFMDFRDEMLAGLESLGYSDPRLAAGGRVGGDGQPGPSLQPTKGEAK